MLLQYSRGKVSDFVLNCLILRIPVDTRSPIPMISVHFSVSFLMAGYYIVPIGTTESVRIPVIFAYTVGTE